MRTALVAAITLVAGIVTWLLLGSRSTREQDFSIAVQAAQRGDAEFLRSYFDEEQTSSSGCADRLALLEAILFLRNKDYSTAIERLSVISTEGELASYVLLYAGQALHGLNRLSEAEVLLNLLVEKEPNNPEARRWLGVVYYDLGAYDYALKEFARLAELVPGDYRSFRLSGLMYRDFGLNAEAIEAYQKALDRNPPDHVRGEIVEELASSLIAQRQYAEASLLIRSASESAGLCVLLAQLEWSEGRGDVAMKQLARARSFGSAETSALLLEAEILSASGRNHEAIVSLRQAVAIAPFDAECHYRLGMILRDTGNSDDADRELSRWKQLKDLSTQLSELNFKALHDPNDIKLRRQLANVCESLGKTELAAMWNRVADGMMDKNGLTLPSLDGQPFGRPKPLTKP